MLATLAAFNDASADCPPGEIRHAGDSLIYALMVRCQDRGCKRKEIAGTLGVEIDDVHRLIARHRTGAEYAVDEHSLVSKGDSMNPPAVIYAGKSTQGPQPVDP